MCGCDNVDDLIAQANRAIPASINLTYRATFDDSDINEFSNQSDTEAKIREPLTPGREFWCGILYLMLKALNLTNKMSDYARLKSSIVIERLVLNHQNV